MPARDRVGRPTEVVRFGFAAMLVMWLALPFLLIGNLAQDAIPYLVAGELAGADSSAVYGSRNGDLYELEPEFARRSCDLSPVGTNCAELSVSFVSTPAALPLAWAVARLGRDGGVLALRVGAAAALVGGMVVLWRRLRARRPDALPWLAASLLPLTVFAMLPVTLGQTSPVLFLSAALGVDRSTRSRALVAGASAVWVLAVVLKAWPAALVLLLLAQRRWAFLAWSALWGALLLLATLPFTPFTIVDDFVATSSGLNATAAVNAYNGSLDVLVHRLWPAEAGGAGLTLLVARVVLVAAAWWWGGRRAGPDTQWALGYVNLLALIPLVWWHYVWVVVAAVAVAVAERPSGRHDAALLVGVALVALPFSLPDNGAAGSVARALLLIGAIVLVGALARPRAAPSPPPDAGQLAAGKADVLGLP